MVAMSHPTTSVVGLLILPGGLLVDRGLRNSMMKRGKQTTPIEILPPNSWLNYLLAPTPIAFQLTKFSDKNQQNSSFERTCPTQYCHPSIFTDDLLIVVGAIKGCSCDVNSIYCGLLQYDKN
jgi:hypothetical protein